MYTEETEKTMKVAEALEMDGKDHSIQHEWARD